MSVLGSDPDVPVSELLFELPIQEMLYELIYALECATRRFWLVLGLGGSDRAETEQGRRTTIELRFA